MRLESGPRPRFPPADLTAARRAWLLRDEPMSLLRLLAFLPCFLWARAGAAQSLAYFTPSAPRDGALELGYVREDRARARTASEWPRSEFGWLFARQSGTQRNFDAPEPAPGVATRWSLALEDDGEALLGWDLPPRVEELAAAELGAFLRERGGASALALLGPDLRRAGARVKLVRLESLARHVRGARADGIVLSKGGQRMELRAMLDPASAGPGKDLAFKLYLPPGGAENVLVRAVQLATGAVQALELAEGLVRAQLPAAGPWCLEAHRLRRADGELELASTTLVFELPAAGGGGR